MKDKFSAERVALLHPKARQVFTDFINECEDAFGVTLGIAHGYRTIAYQDALYALGRTRPGRIVTNAKGGQSLHNFGLAIGLVQMTEDDTIVNWNYDIAILKSIAGRHKLTWRNPDSYGEDHIKDTPHFELHFGYPQDCKALLALYESGKVDGEGYVDLE